MRLVNDVRQAARAATRGLVRLAAAATKKPRIGTGEVGGGLAVVGGIPELDYVDELGYPDFIEAFKRVANDPQVAREIRAVREPILAADREVEPASDDERDIQIAEFVSANLYQDEGELYGREFWCQTDADDRLRDALRMLQTGFALFQVIWRRQGRFYVYDKFKYLLPETIQKFYFEKDSDQLLRIERAYTRIDGTQAIAEFIDAEDLFIYTWNREGSSIFGKPFIREMWKPYSFKVKYEKFGIIDKQRTSVGVPFFQNPAGDSPENIRRGEQIAQSMRGGNYERLWVRMDEGQDFGWKEGGQSTKGLPDLVRLQNQEIATAGMASFLGLGQEGSGGSRGVAGTQASFSSLMMTGGVRNLVKHENALIRPLVDVNFPGVPRYPKAKFANVDPFEKTRSIPEFTAAISTPAVQADLDTENEIRRRFGFMERVEKEKVVDSSLIQRAFLEVGFMTRDELRQAVGLDPIGGAIGSEFVTIKPDAAATIPTADPADDPDAEDPADQAGEGGDTTEQKDGGAPTATASRRRRPLRLEDDPGGHMERARVDPEAIRRQLERLEGVYLVSARQVRSDMVDAVAAMIADGSLRPKAVADVRVPFQKDLADRLLAVAKSARDFGRDQVQREINRQLLHLARRAVPNPSTRNGSINYSNRQAEVMVGLDVSNLVNALQSEVVSRYNLLAGTGLSDTEIARQIDDALKAVGSRQMEDMARQSTSVTFNAGRNVAIQEFKPQLEDFVIRTEVPKDKAQCEPCTQLNGTKYIIGSQEYHENQPPAKCLGRHRCRGFYAVFARA